MDVQIASLCDAAQDYGGKLCLVGAFDTILVRQFPALHPFCSGTGSDVRMTTRYREDDFLPSLMGTIHETGHGRYEQGLRRDWLGLPIANARSMGLHESQSLSFEMQLGSHPAFARLLSPLVIQQIGRAHV